MMPSFFIAHGAPSLVLEDHVYSRFLKQAAAFHPKPKAIVVFSAHWENPVQTVSTAPRHGVIYDFSGFQEELYQVTYPAEGHPLISSDIVKLLAEAGIPVQTNRDRGLDHGVWGVLKLLYPDADIPVIALSVNRNLSNVEQYRIGQALAALREKDVLVIGSGGTVHNLRQVRWGMQEAEPWAQEFDRWLEEKLTAWDTDALFRYRELAPHAERAVPTTEHFVPLLLAMGAGDRTRQARLLHRSYQHGNLSLSMWQFQ